MSETIPKQPARRAGKAAGRRHFSLLNRTANMKTNTRLTMSTLAAAALSSALTASNQRSSAPPVTRYNPEPPEPEPRKEPESLAVLYSYTSSFDSHLWNSPLTPYSRYRYHPVKNGSTRSLKEKKARRLKRKNTKRNR